MVALPVPLWEEVVAKRIVSNELSRERRISIALLSAQIHSDSVKLAMKDRDIADERALKNTARMERDDCMTINGKLSRKVRNRTPWARAAQVQVCVIVVAGIVFGYQQLAP